MHDADHLLPLDLKSGAGGDGGGRGQMQRAQACEGLLSDKVTWRQEGDGGLFAIR